MGEKTMKLNVSRNKKDGYIEIRVNGTLVAYYSRPMYKANIFICQQSVRYNLASLLHETRKNENQD